jgi:hypothetical protein
MRTLISTLMILALAAPAIAVQNSDPDQVGIYFDLDAETNSMTVDPEEPFLAYLILANPTGANVEAFSFRYRIEVPPELEPMFLTLSQSIPPMIIIFFCEEPDSQFDCQIDWGNATPWPAEQATILYTWQFIIFEPMDVKFFLEPGDIGLIYQSEGDLLPMYPVSGSFDAPVANVNGEAVVATDQATFGTLKALYR